MSVNYILYQLTLKENFLHCAIIDTKQFLEYKKYFLILKLKFFSYVKSPNVNKFSAYIEICKTKILMIIKVIAGSKLSLPRI